MEIVRVASVASGRTASRSALTARLTLGATGSPGVASPTVRSWPEANCPAPNASETASAARIPVTFCDMAWSLAPAALGDSSVSRQQSSRTGRSHNRVRKNFNPIGTTFFVGSHSGSRLFPPAPLTGDVGRDRGDAGRALLFLPFQAAALAKPPSATPELAQQINLWKPFCASRL